MLVRCKRPGFHDDYLPTFNRDNVTLVDTDGQGVEGLTKNGVLAGGKEYPIDCLVLATGFRSPFAGAGDPAAKSNVTVKGRNGATLGEKWARGIATLHGYCTNGFPNLFWAGYTQGALDGNITHCSDHQSRHVAYVVAEALKKSNGHVVIVEPTVEAEEDWSMQVAARAMGYAQMAGCTPGCKRRDPSLRNLHMLIHDTCQTTTMKARLTSRCHQKFSSSKPALQVGLMVRIYVLCWKRAVLTIPQGSEALPPSWRSGGQTEGCKAWK